MMSSTVSVHSRVKLANPHDNRLASFRKIDTIRTLMLTVNLNILGLEPLSHATVPRTACVSVGSVSR